VRSLRVGETVHYQTQPDRRDSTRLEAVNVVLDQDVVLDKDATSQVTSHLTSAGIISKRSSQAKKPRELLAELETRSSKEVARRKDLEAELATQKQLNNDLHAKIELLEKRLSNSEEPDNILNRVAC
jgi:hypothetical protein